MGMYRGYPRSSGAACYPTPNECPPPRPTSVTVQSPPIRRGETVSFGAGLWGHIQYGRIAVTHFIYTGSKDLWLLSSSNARAMSLFPTDIHLDSFRPGAPCEVDWLSAVRSEDFQFVVEHRTKIKNAQPAQFIARIVGFPEF